MACLDKMAWAQQEVAQGRAVEWAWAAALVEDEWEEIDRAVGQAGLAYVRSAVQQHLMR